MQKFLIKNYRPKFSELGCLLNLKINNCKSKHLLHDLDITSAHEH